MEGGKLYDFFFFSPHFFDGKLPLSHSTVTLDTFIDFLSLCESNGFIELKLCLEELREKVGARLPRVLLFVNENGQVEFVIQNLYNLMLCGHQSVLSGGGSP